MKQTKVYETDDGQTFKDLGRAQQHETMLKLRGVINSAKSDRTVPVSSDPATQAATAMVENFDEVKEILLRFGRIRAGAKAAANKGK